MKCYVVGGAVRDALLGLPLSDRDWVVVGATPEAMLEAGFKPVGKDFPVFLHPQTREEYALARTERKTAPGYHGFSVHAAPEVTLEEDLQRRDLTINAIAQSPDGQLIDPWGGQADLNARVFRHISPAFAEDPVRILRVARFAARFGDFSLAPETLALMQAMVTAGEVDHLVAERVWQELARGLLAATPSRMLSVLAACGALSRLLPELAASVEAAGQRCDAAAAAALDLAQRFALLCLDLACSDSVQALSLRLRVANEVRELALLLWREARAAPAAAGDTAAAFIARCERCDAWRRPARFDALLAALALVQPSWPYARWQAALTALQSLDLGAIAKACADKASIPAAVHSARLAALETVFA